MPHCMVTVQAGLNRCPESVAAHCGLAPRRTDGLAEGPADAAVIWPIHVIAQRGDVDTLAVLLDAGAARVGLYRTTAGEDAAALSAPGDPYSTCTQLCSR